MAEGCETSSFPERNGIRHFVPLDYAHARGDDVRTMSAASESNSELLSADYKHEGSSKCQEQVSDGVVSAQVKSDISTEISGSIGDRCCLIASEDGLNDRQRTGSSCSESLSVVLPVSFPNSTSKETCSFGHCDRGSEEVVTASSESDVSAQIACQALRKQRSGHGGEKMMNLEMSTTEPAKKGPDKVKSERLANQLHGKAAMEFDLNEDIYANGMDEPFVSSQRVIQVVAKAGRPSGQPKIPLKFEGRLGWKGTAETSAFRSTGLSKSSERRTPSEPKEFLGIDLNAAAAAVEEDSAAGEVVPPLPLLKPHSEIDSQGRPWIDLNCLSDDLIHPPASENLCSLDLNGIGNNPASPRNHYSNFMGHDYLTGFGSVASNAHVSVPATNILQPVELMQSVASLQHPSRARGPYHFGSSRGPIPSAVPVHYARYPHPHEHGIYPALLNPSTVHPAFCTPHLVQIVHEPNSGNTPSSIPRVVITEDNLPPTYGILTDEARRLHQVSGYATSMKRKEPEGGFRGYQLGYK